ncbi:hypothetical protein L2E82_39168 [Cichorium intybus]|uniref:Uncharacterized protein n=1 Tax=Cichorium intybus TaxID=13427 RepID=A0ACB9AIR9_CICIN|nr:hypothetical protein L2E82_39168 [Cichorium intybus]
MLSPHHHSKPLYDSQNWVFDGTSPSDPPLPPLEQIQKDLDSTVGQPHHHLYNVALPQSLLIRFFYLAQTRVNKKEVWVYVSEASISCGSISSDRGPTGVPSIGF